MAESDLSFASTKSFRNALMAKNLAPYNIPGVYSPQVSQVAYETQLTVSNVVDSPNDLISNSPYSKQLYVLNSYAPTGGYNLNITYNQPANVLESNQGVYDINDTKLDLVNEFNIDAAYIENVYGPQGGFNNMVEITDLQNNNQIHQPYWSPPSFEPSTYSPYSIILESNPVGDNGPLSNDSFIAKLGSERLKFAFQERIGAELFQATVGALDLQSLQDPYEATLLATGQQPLITKDYTITVAENPISRAALFALKLSSTYLPVSPIPGDYFNENTRGGQQSNQTSSALNVINSLTGGFLGPILDLKRNPSQIFLANTGNGQRSVLFNNLDFNRYQPGYDRTYGGIIGIGLTAVQTALSLIGLNSVGGYYVGSKNSEPSTITSPPNQIPVDPFGRQNSTPVYGPSELATLYEGNIGRLNFGLPAKPTIDSGGISGSFVWTSPKTKGGAGYKARPGGGISSLDQEFNQISNDYTKSQSTEVQFKKSSILDQTQRLINSADNVAGITKLKHVGNAINQVSKVFNDGYKEMTKGSQVVSYKDDTTGAEVGIEYCRVFSKDTPYYTYKDLQKSAGITKEGRRFSYSVMDSTYNLNIAPMKGEDSTNIVKNNQGKFYAKKYMFSIENLAWRTSSRPGYTYDDLPDCEKGPNGGRVMWFPPYELNFNDTSRANWNPTSFLGRPEPIYTYKDSTRTGQINWKIIVDSPSVLNLLVDKQLKGVNNKKVDSILDSFFAGCVKFDLYTLAKKFNTFSMSELMELQTIISQPQLTAEEAKSILNQIPVVNVPPIGNGAGNPNSTPDTKQTDGQISELKTNFLDYAFYFDIDSPSSPTNYETLYNDYITKKTNYQTQSNGYFTPGDPQTEIVNFFDTVIENNWKILSQGEESFVKKTERVLKDGNRVLIKLKGSASSINTQNFNTDLNKKRADSVIEYFKNTDLNKYIESGTLKVEFDSEEETDIQPKSENLSGEGIDCKKQFINQTSPANLYSRDATACRRVKISAINIEINTSTTTSTTKKIVIQESGAINDAALKLPTAPQPVIDVRQKLKDGIGKKILRRLLSECDYFEMIKEDAPFIYDSIKEKIRYFNPAFHSMTPEGLNSRLTFLNQCVRPGETIPVIGPDGRPKYNDAQNTSFGAPPILVLRIGDFYHTKIVPRDVTITYDPLLYDLNPEGIGVQPMIAKISLSFDFIGGHGLARPVEQLQNALSFNYYANTEIYDERAIWTEDTSKLDKEIFDALFDGEVSALEKDAEKPQEKRGGKTIGDIATTVPVTGGETGVISYQKIADTTLSVSKQYFTTLYNTAKKISDQYNYGVWQMITTERKYNEGDFYLAETAETSPPTTKKVPIFGKSNNLELRLQYLGESVLTDIRTGTGTNNFIIKKMFELDMFQSADIERLRINLDQYTSGLIGTFNPPIFEAMQTFTIFQQDMVQNFRKLNVVNNRTDGKILENGKPFVYALSATSEVSNTSGTISDTITELRVDYETLGLTYIDFDTFTKNQDIKLVTDSYPKDANNAGGFTPLSTKLNNSSIQDKRFYMLICRIFSDLNKLTEFKNFLLKDGLKEVPKFEKKLNKVCEDFRDIVRDELEQQNKFFDKIKNNSQFINFEKLDIYKPGKTRKFNYSTVITDTTIKTEKEKLVKDVWSDVNLSSNNSWDDKIKFD